MYKYMDGYKVDTEIPRKIEFNYHARGFYCPTCLTGLSLKYTKCPYCGQKLINPWE